MKRYLVLYQAPISMAEQVVQTPPEEMQRVMGAWQAWAERCGLPLDGWGAPLHDARRLTASGTAASDTQVTGYSIIQAEDMAGAVALLDGHPHLAAGDGFTIDVLEAQEMGG